MGVPSRRIGKSYRSSTGVIQSTKDQSRQKYESRLERDLMTLVDSDPTVRCYQAQPLTLPYEMASGKPSHYTPDLLIEFLPDPVTGVIREPWLVEVKYREDLKKIWPEYRLKMKAARKYATEKGWKFHILTELEIRSRYLAAIIPLSSYLSREVPEPVLAALLATMKELGESTVQDLVDKALPGMPAEDIVVPLRCLIAKRKIWTDLSKPFLRPTSILKAADAPDPTFCWGTDGPPMRTRQMVEKPKPVVPGSGPASFRIEPGIEVTINERPATILALGGFKDTWVKFHDTGARELAPNSTIRPANPLAAVPVVMPDLLSVADGALCLAEKRLAVLAPLLVGRCSHLDVQEAADKLECSPATVYRLMAKYRKTGLLTSLLPTKPNGGRGKARAGEEVVKIMDDVIETFYLTPQKPTVKATYRKIKKLCGDLKLVPPHLNTLRNRIALISDYEKTKRRQTVREARERFDVTRGSFPGANKPYECVEIDHTPTDVLLVDPDTGLIIGRACLTVAIDVYSRMVVGYQVSLDAPSNMVAGLCLANTVLPKDKWLEKYGIKSEWPCVGKPKNLHLDNAGEFSGSYMETLCSQWGIAIHWRPLGETQYGGHIERLIGTICREMHCLPGTTFSNVRERGKYASEDQAVFTLEEFEAWLARFVCDVYHNTPHSGLGGQTPLERYREGVFGSALMVGFGHPEQIEQGMHERFRLDMLPFEKRKVGREGIQIECIKYNDFVLSTFRRESGEGNSKEYLVRYDPRDMSIVYLWDDIAQEHIPIPYANSSFEPLSLWEIKAAKSFLKARGGDTSNEYAIHEAYSAMQKIEEAAVKSTKQRRRAAVKHVQDRKNAIHPTLSINKPKHRSEKALVPVKVSNGPDETTYDGDDTDSPGIVPLRVPLRKFTVRHD